MPELGFEHHPSSDGVTSDSSELRPCILIVDDEPKLSRVLERVLLSAGYDVVTMNDPVQAIALVKGNRFDAIVSDISMPRLDGLQMLRLARDHDLDVPVLLVTGAPNVETAIEAIQYGAFQYFTKPVDPQQFRRAVDRAVQLHRIALMKREALSFLGTSQGLVGDRAGLEASLRRALDTLRMDYQPIVRTADRSLFGYEALLRSGEPSLPDPAAVLDAAERLGRLDELGRAVRSLAPAPLLSRPEEGCLFVNLHTRDLLDPTLTSPHSVLAAMADRVVLEITERASLDAIKDVRGRVAALRKMGFRLAIDDLGAGYAGLASFAILEPEFVKLDITLVRNVHQLPMKQRLIRSMTSLCKEMGMLVIGEGVESKEERQALVELGCDLLQGNLFARPGPPFPAFVWDIPAAS